MYGQANKRQRREINYKDSRVEELDDWMGLPTERRTDNDEPQKVSNRNILIHIL